MGVILLLEKVSKSYGALRVTDCVSFDVAEGEALGIIGPNAAGKSTLFNLITGNVLPDKWKITLLGRDVTRVSPMERCLMGVGRSFQIPQPFGNLTVFENLVVAATHGQKKSEREVTDLRAEVLERTELLPRANEEAGGSRPSVICFRCSRKSAGIQTRPCRGGSSRCLPLGERS